MTCKAVKGKHSQVGVLLAEAIQLADSIIAVFQLGLNQRQELIRIESESGDKFLKVAVVSEYTRKVAVSLDIPVNEAFG